MTMKDRSPNKEARNAIELKLNGELEAIDAKTVADGIELLRKLVGSFDPSGAPVKMASLRTGSTVTGVAAPPEAEESILHAIEMIRANQVLPANWSSKQADLLRELTKLSSRSGVESAEIVGRTNNRSSQLDSVLMESIQEAMRKTPISIGSVVGKLYSYQDSAKGLSARLRDALTNEDVRVTFGEDLDASIRRNLRNVVEISGLLKRHPETNSPEEIEAKSVDAVSAKPARLRPRHLEAVEG
ncbi:hypothetical protein JKI95_10310 [Corynebacterium aquatimens]|uniref:hypothetical protein n=1 Tax=Corynebacterium aquatimens TaxID=1190508 RepID=UPI00253FD54D|nr:hypothetical protein [Corynebacterium aquatimens]QYH19462.1 hypothetical protein JKI95_10310 [Corynebacterium aquatimens]